MRALDAKIRSNAGETISETLVALLISALALVMLAGSITAASGMVTKSRSKLSDYYDANEYLVTMDSSKKTDDTETANDTISVKIDGATDEKFSVSVNTFVNKIFGDSKAVITYKKQDS